MRVSFLTPEDLLLINEFHTTADLSFWSLEKLESCLSHPDYCAWKLSEADTILAYILINRAGTDEAHIMHLAVHPAHRQKGYGTYLLKTVLDFLAAEKRTMILEVHEHNTPAIHLYEKLGFQKIGMRKNYYSQPKRGDAWMYQLKNDRMPLIRPTGTFSPTGEKGSK